MLSHLIRREDSSYDELESSDYTEDYDLDDADSERHGLTNRPPARRSSSWRLGLLRKIVPFRLRRLLPRVCSRKSVKYSRRWPSNSCSFLWFRFWFFFKILLVCVVLIVVFTAIFLPSYNSPPAHYGALRRRIKESNDFGRANIDNQKIFIAASIYDKGGHLVKGQWGRRVLQLLDLLGNQNVFLSIFENDGDSNAREALKEFGKEVQCNKNLVFEEHLPLDHLPRVTLSDGSRRIKRIAYLAEVRNQALAPLEDELEVVYDKVLFLNDVIFDPIDAVQLLFSTNVNENGKASYNAACAVDFINPFKFYDTFATRDIEGYSMGVPFFPWYSNAGRGLSRQDVLGSKDAVRVKSCWGGMVAFDANFFQRTQIPRNETETSDEDQASSEPIRFRPLPDRDRDASECCLVHADILSSASELRLANDTGIYQNPYIRVAYGTWTLRLLPITRRFERLYSIPHNLINHLVGLPWHNERREDVFGSSVASEASHTPQAEHIQPEGDGYCGIKTLQLLRESPRQGEKNWETVSVP